MSILKIKAYNAFQRWRATGATMALYSHSNEKVLAATLGPTRRGGNLIEKPTVLTTGHNRALI
ncbi:hypothetical protein PHYBLDRAFT_138233 [Phycomyces blakesleeanus NRRL 1555(-)]|uniref:Uncharacterized protein n=1 Tax=Phycomyces blakesleeanus (strain ATCC 8743b / DSM 1359 / FGSC 10004 / NBRC 33097 / NRRL 1555) TaxID=763407 RepID=A0A167R2D6_PHYB8|nr:hypothetical protein PHYBLDRAFT_138233 [Phycomyces blakesleeanus NRRL 1555(-)]OAD80688.1 hypothetical protein PHYBLDRAFT_138233 [Phycomyces blakesleeanus NRRL 1555(-)]|eukprot:XP_018298728.1 hypothetical protein PHYBLDRAFT_138233 [Phycomyces blakesleeanus NRRL 1555(-)]